MRIQDFISSQPITRVGIFIGQHMPRWIGYGLARIISSIIARRKPEIYWTVRANLRHILGPEADDATLHKMAQQVFYHAGQTYYDFFHTIGQPQHVIAEAVKIPQETVELIEGEIAGGRGALLLATHMSNFDLAGLSVGARGFPIQMLSIANPRSGFYVVNYLRAKGGYEVTPITPQSLRTAIRRLESGGLVLTGMDHPIPRDKDLVEVFGQPAYLPLGPVRLAMMTDALVLMGSCHFDSEEGYVLEATEPLDMVHTDDRGQDILANARRLAAILERFVRARPEQWMMFYPFWPEEPEAEDKG